MNVVKVCWAPGEIPQVRQKFCQHLDEYVVFLTYIHNLVENILTSFYLLENKNISQSVLIFGELH